ncbi:MAG: cell wall-active antibiotics response protein [Tannerellaceae bacterium]|jgi:predicted membrane protein|nr:cell wall-active antibiotics response protein [Tannerellaceae bacterium]
MNMYKLSHPHWHRTFNTIVTALIFIVAGSMLLGRNLDLIPAYVFHIVVSWQMLLIVLGLSSLIKRNLAAGFIFLVVGTFFLIPVITGVEGEWFRTYWPVIFIIIGIVLLFKRWNFKRHRGCKWGECDEHAASKELFSEDGFVKADVSFGAARYIVLDPVFRGADIDVSFGSVTLDLRKASLDESQTYIDIDCSFGGIELFIPAHWNVQVKADSTLSGCEDKRHISQVVDYEHKLIIKGDLTFSGIEIKN